MIAFEIKEQSLKQRVEIGQAITTPFEHLESVVEAFDKVVGNFVPIAMQRLEKAVETGQASVATWVSQARLASFL